MLGAGDCELLQVDRLLAQPVNAISALAFLAVGVWLLGRRQSLIGALTASVGVGSFLFHGPQPPGARWIHDASILALLVAVARPIDRPRVTIGLATAGASVLAAAPDLAVPLLAVAALGAVLSAIQAARGELERLRVPAALAGVAALADLLGRTGGPLCDPGGVFQLHALWHVLMALAIGAWARNRPVEILEDSY